MARIRTVKPEFFKHEELYSAEKEYNLPLRIAFVGLWCSSDREGRFKWRPNQLKLDILPYDVCDFSRVMDALATRGFIEQYQDEKGNLYGFIPTFSQHQVINNRESQSLILSPFDACATRDPRGLSMHKGKGKEGKGKEKEGKEMRPATRDAPEPKIAKVKNEPLQNACRETWASYSNAYFDRYGTEPVRNAKVNKQVIGFVERIGFEESPLVASNYLNSNNSYYVGRGHTFDCLLADAEKLRTEWATGKGMTTTRANQIDKSQSNHSAVAEALKLLERE